MECFGQVEKNEMELSTNLNELSGFMNRSWHKEISKSDVSCWTLQQLWTASCLSTKAYSHIYPSRDHPALSAQPAATQTFYQARITLEQYLTKLLARKLMEKPNMMMTNQQKKHFISFLIPSQHFYNVGSAGSEKSKCGRNAMMTN